MEPKEIAHRLQAEGARLWLCSHGGCATNAVSHYLESLGLTVRTDTWKRWACHSARPYRLTGLPLVYLTASDITACVLSQHRQGTLAMNFEKMGVTDGSISVADFDPVTLEGLDLDPWRSQMDAWRAEADAVLLYEHLERDLPAMLYLLFNMAPAHAFERRPRRAYLHNLTVQENARRAVRNLALATA